MGSSQAKSQFPIIGVSGCLFPKDPNRAVFKGQALIYALETVNDILLANRAMPWLAPRTNAENTALFVSKIDGLLLQGGSDIAPKCYGEEPIRPEWSGDYDRDVYELGLIEECIKQKKPILGICRGFQLLNVYFGGTLHQDLTNAIRHRNWEIYEHNWHKVKVLDNTNLSRIYSGLTLSVNSVHHQGVKTLGKNLVVEAVSQQDDDGLVEAFRHERHDPRFPWIYGVQWHPEFHSEKIPSLADPHPLIRMFLSEVRKSNENH